ncbi:MAG: glycosyltransferase [Halothiobacillaceae bacterium]|nr:glycosyltransferase [Halothiobacillaceae bacterium]
MAHADPVARKLKVVRVVTASHVVPWHLANTLKRLPADFEVYVVGQMVSAHRDVYPGVHWIDIDLERKTAPLADLKALFSLYRILRAIRPDIVHSIMPKAGLLTALAGLLARVPVRMHTYTGQVWATRHGVARNFYRLIDWLINALDTLCMTDSPSQSAFLQREGIAHHGGSLPVLSGGSLSGVDTTRFHPDAETGARIRAELNIPGDAVVFLFLGRMNRDKGLLDLAIAFDALRDVHAHLVLGGPDEEGIARAILARTVHVRERVHLTGFATRPEAYMAAADVFCLPSYREGFGSVVIEAAACGLPAIGSRIPGLVDAIEDGRTGMLFPVGDTAALATCMRAMLADGERRRMLGDQASLRARERFGADVLYACLKATYYRQAGLAARD